MATYSYQQPVSKVTTKRGLSRGAKRIRAAVILALIITVGGQFFQWQGAQATSQNPNVQIEYVNVHPGDNLWRLAEKYAPQADTQSWIQQVIQINNLASSEIQPGQQLAIPSN